MSLKKIIMMRIHLEESSILGQTFSYFIPIIGTLKTTNTNTTNGDTAYQTWFARQQFYYYIRKKENSITFRLNFLRKRLPFIRFQFELQIRYTLVDYQLYIAGNQFGPQTMAFSISTSCFCIKRAV
jgi:hypothetical protein